jgi:hypothetical protein
VKSRVYANKPQTVPELKAEIERVIGEIEPQLCGNIIENFVKTARVCQQSRGGRLSDIVFAVCVLYTEIKISALFSKWCILLQN